jgi:hypothetical protein
VALMVGLEEIRAISGLYDPDDPFDQDIGGLAEKQVGSKPAKPFRGSELSGSYAGYRMPFPSRHQSVYCLA